jgi:hypothetical protein
MPKNKSLCRRIRRQLDFRSERTPHPDPLPVWRGEGIEAPGGPKTLPELFQAAGCRFEFSEKTLQPLAKTLLEELQKM